MPQACPTQSFTPAGYAVSRICLGCMGLSGTWTPGDPGPENKRRAIAAFEAALENGINFFDHADIYGATSCESVFKDCLAAVPGVRDRIFIATKVGLGNGVHDLSPEHIKAGIRASLDRMGIDYADLYQLHRPDPLCDPEATAEALDSLVEEGVIHAVGISNYYPQQTLALRQFLQAPIVSNQISISLMHLEPIYEGAVGGNGSGVLDQCEELGITPLAYSPLSKGLLSGHRELPADHPDHGRATRILDTLRELGPAYGGATPGQLALAWLLAHPAGIIPVVGSTNPAHIAEAVGATSITLSRADWYKLWVAARGERLP